MHLGAHTHACTDTHTRTHTHTHTYTQSSGSHWAAEVNTAESHVSALIWTTSQNCLPTVRLLVLLPPPLPPFAPTDNPTPTATAHRLFSPSSCCFMGLLSLFPSFFALITKSFSLFFPFLCVYYHCLYFCVYIKHLCVFSSQ